MNEWIEKELEFKLSKQVLVAEKDIFTNDSELQKWKEQELVEYNKMQQVKEMLVKEFINCTGTLYDLIAWKDVIVKLNVEKSHQTLHHAMLGDLIVLLSKLYRKHMLIYELSMYFYSLVFANFKLPKEVVNKITPKKPTVKQMEEKEIQSEPWKGLSKEVETKLNKWLHVDAAAELDLFDQDETEKVELKQESKTPEAIRLQKQEEQFLETMKIKLDSSTMKPSETKKTTTTKKKKKEEPQELPLKMDASTQDSRFDFVGFRMLVWRYASERKKSKTLEKSLLEANTQITQLKTQLQEKEQLISHLKEETNNTDQRTAELEHTIMTLYDELAEAVVETEKSYMNQYEIEKEELDTVMKDVIGVTFKEDINSISTKIKEFQYIIHLITNSRETMQTMPSELQRKLAIMGIQTDGLVENMEQIQTDIHAMTDSLDKFTLERIVRAKLDVKQLQHWKRENQKMIRIKRLLFTLRKHCNAFKELIHLIDPSLTIHISKELFPILFQGITHFQLEPFGFDSKSITQEQNHNNNNLKQLLMERCFEMAKELHKVTELVTDRMDHSDKMSNELHQHLLTPQTNFLVQQKLLSQRMSPTRPAISRPSTTTTNKSKPSTPLIRKIVTENVETVIVKQHTTIMESMDLQQKLQIEVNKIKQECNTKMKFMKDVYEYRIAELEAKLAEYRKQNQQQQESSMIRSPRSNRSQSAKVSSHPIATTTTTVEQELSNDIETTTQPFVVGNIVKRPKTSAIVSSKELAPEQLSVTPLTRISNKQQNITSASMTTSIPSPRNTSTIPFDHKVNEIWQMKREEIVTRQKEKYEMTMFYLDTLDKEFANLKEKELALKQLKQQQQQQSSTTTSVFIPPSQLDAALEEIKQKEQELLQQNMNEEHVKTKKKSLWNDKKKLLHTNVYHMVFKNYQPHSSQLQQQQQQVINAVDGFVLKNSF